MSDKDNNKLKYNPGQKCMKVPFIINADLESLLEKMNTFHNDPEKSSATKINILVIHYVHTVRFTQQKVSLIIIEAKIV